MKFFPKRWLVAIIAVSALVALAAACGQATPTPTSASPTATPTKAAPTATPTTAAAPTVATATPTKVAGTPAASPTAAAGGPSKIPVSTKSHIEPTPGLDCLMCHPLGGAGVGQPGGVGIPNSGPNDHTGRTKDACQTCHVKG